MLSLDGLNQSGLLAANVRPGASVDEDVKVVAAAAGVLPDQALLVGLGDGQVQVARLVVELAADVDVGGAGAHRPARHQAALN